MRSLIRYLRCAALLLAALALSTHHAEAAGTNGSTATARLNELFEDQVVAEGTGVKVTRTMLDDQFIMIKAAAAARGQQIPPQAMQALEARLLAQLIGVQVLAPDATEADKATAAATVEKQMAQMIEGAGGEENFARQLKAVGMTRDALVKRVTDEAIADAVLRRALKVEVPDGEVKKFYDENPNRFEQPETVHAAHILVGTTEADGSEMTAAKKKTQLALAEKLKQRAEGGEDFGKLAKEYSDDPGSKNSGGEYTFPRGQMVPEFEAVAFAQKPGQISDPVTTKFGYHVIKTIEKKDAKTVPFEEARPDIRKFLETRALQAKIPDYLEKREAEAKVEILDKDLKAFITQAKEAARKAAAEVPGN